MPFSQRHSLIQTLIYSDVDRGEFPRLEMAKIASIRPGEPLPQTITNIY